MSKLCLSHKRSLSPLEKLHLKLALIFWYLSRLGNSFGYIGNCYP